MSGESRRQETGRLLRGIRRGIWIVLAMLALWFAVAFLQALFSTVEPAGHDRVDPPSHPLHSVPVNKSGD